MVESTRPCAGGWADSGGTWVLHQTPLCRAHFLHKKLLCCKWLYEGCSDSNVSYVIKLAHDVRGRCWWYGNRGWTFPPVSHYILLPCNRWQHRSSLTKWRLTWKCMGRNGVSLNSSMWKTWHSLAFTDACWMFLKTKQWIWAQWGSGWCISAVATVTAGHLCWCGAENLLYETVLLCSLYPVVSIINK